MYNKGNDMSRLEYLLGYMPSMSTPLKALSQTWAKRCSNMIVFTTQKTARYPLVPLNTTSDVSSWRAYHEAILYLAQYIDKHNWFFLVEEDTYVIVENLAYYLSIFNFNEPYYFGHALQGWGAAYNGAGPGTALSKGSMRKLFNHLSKGHWPPSSANGETSLGRCLLDVGVVTMDTRDELGRERFLMFQPETLLIPGNLPWTSSFSTSSKYGIKEVSWCFEHFSLIYCMF